MNRRKLIEMDEAERLEFFNQEKVAVVGSFGPRGWPHLMPLWYVVRDGEIWSWTFTKSQKIKNLERDSRATVLVEAGDEYAELRGVQMECEAVFHRDLDLVTDFAVELVTRYAPGDQEVTPEASEAFRAQAPKRTVLQFRPQRIISWDHRKLGGVY